MTTVSPRASSASATCEPMNPAPPVTRTHFFDVWTVTFVTDAYLPGEEAESSADGEETAARAAVESVRRAVTCCGSAEEETEEEEEEEGGVGYDWKHLDFFVTGEEVS